MGYYTPVTTTSFVWVSNSRYERHYFDSCPNLTQLDIKIGLVKDNSYSPQLLKCISRGYNKQRIVMYPTLESSLRMLALDKIQLLPAIEQIAQHLSQSIKLDGIIIHPSPLFSKSYYTVFSKKTKFSSKEYADIYALTQAFSNVLKKTKINHLNH